MIIIIIWPAGDRSELTNEKNSQFQFLSVWTVHL